MANVIPWTVAGFATVRVAGFVAGFTVWTIFVFILRPFKISDKGDLRPCAARRYKRHSLRLRVGSGWLVKELNY
jgi:hypothetical protein